MIDAQHENHLDLMADELHKSGLRLNIRRPDVVVKRTGQGGINITSTVKQSNLSEEVIRSIASEYVINADIIIRENLTEDRLIDVFLENRVYVPVLVVINKIDLLPSNILISRINSIRNKGWKVIAVSAIDGRGLSRLREYIFSELRLIRVYMKPVGRPVDFNEPLILHEDDRVEDACRRLHREFKDRFRYANVSGPSAKHDIQKVGLDHVLHDGDVLTIVISR